MKKDVMYDVINGLECLLVTVADKNVHVDDTRWSSKEVILERIRDLRKEVIDGEIGILPEQKTDLSQYTVGEVKDICIKHKYLNEYNEELCSEDCPFLGANSHWCPFDYDPKNWGITRQHLTNTIIRNGEDWIC